LFVVGMNFWCSFKIALFLIIQSFLSCYLSVLLLFLLIFKNIDGFDSFPFLFCIQYRYFLCMPYRIYHIFDRFRTSTNPLENLAAYWMVLIPDWQRNWIPNDNSTVLPSKLLHDGEEHGHSEFLKYGSIVILHFLWSEFHDHRYCCMEYHDGEKSIL
jgi:hypothetical protein